MGTPGRRRTTARSRTSRYPHRITRPLQEVCQTGGSAVRCIRFACRNRQWRFAEVSQWPSTQDSFPPGSAVHSTVAAYLKSADLPIEVETVTLEDVLRA